MPEEKIAVRAYAGGRGEEIPKSLLLHHESIEVVSILARWLEEDLAEGRRRKRFFKVQGSDGYVHTVYYDETEKAWYLSKTI